MNAHSWRWYLDWVWACRNRCRTESGQTHSSCCLCWVADRQREKRVRECWLSGLWTGRQDSWRKWKGMRRVTIENCSCKLNWTIRARSIGIGVVIEIREKLERRRSLYRILAFKTENCCWIIDKFSASHRNARQEFHKQVEYSAVPTANMKISL